MQYAVAGSCAEVAVLRKPGQILERQAVRVCQQRWFDRWVNDAAHVAEQTAWWQRQVPQLSLAGAAIFDSEQ
eukprot:15160079-Alexandrium_andersonii.AAC.1